MQSMSWILKQEQENPEMTRDELRKHCSKNYPFSERKGYAYKAFRSAMSDKFGKRQRKNNRQERLI
jgi:hypothetical protein